jgi:hypothetical protein
MIPVLLAWLMKLMVPTAAASKVAPRTKKASDATDAPGGDGVVR